MKKATLIVLGICFILLGTLSADAAETRAAACADKNCPGFLITHDYDVAHPDFTSPCNILEGCTITFRDVVSHRRKIYCSECNTVYVDDSISISSTQSHSKSNALHIK